MPAPFARLTVASFAFLIGGALRAASPALADDATSFAATGIGVARLSLIAGNLTVQRGEDPDQSAGVVNAPLEGGDYVTTGDGASRGEVQFSNITQLRVASDTQLRFTRIDDGDRELQLAVGTIELALLRGPDGSTEIDTPSIGVKPRDRGDYRVSVTNDGTTVVTVRAGSADVLTASGTQTLAAGQTLYAQGPAASPETNVGPAIPFDDFDTFNAARDRAYAAELAGAAWDNDYVDGAGDLAHYGRWVDDPSYGTVWIPAGVAPGWAPYHTGRWVWEEGFGWTWVAAEPWGWAPYHYGRWYYSAAYGWAWYPPPPAIYAPAVVYAPPPVVFQPALVAFFTFGGGGGFSIGFGNVGWVPLAPYEVYHPWYSGGVTVVNRTVINNYYATTSITNVTGGNITRIYANAGAPSAVAAIDSQSFVQGRFAQTQTLAAAQVRALPNAAAVQGALPVVPTRANLHFGAVVAAGAGGAARASFAGAAFAGHAAVVTRVPFARQQAIVTGYVKPLADQAANPATLAPTRVDAYRSATAGAVGLSGKAGTSDLAPYRPASRASSTGTPAASGVAPAANADAWSRYQQNRTVTPAAGNAGAGPDATSGTGVTPGLGTAPASAYHAPPVHTAHVYHAVTQSSRPARTPPPKKPKHRDQ